MNEIQTRSSPETDRTVVLIAYALHLVGSIAAVPSIVGLILNYLKRGQSGELLDTHHRWMIRTFWWAILWIVIGVVTMFILIGWPILAAVWVWYLYRHIKGLLRLADDEPMPT